MTSPADAAIPLEPCAHCGVMLNRVTRSAFHPTNACWLSGYELDDSDYPAWNRRAPAEPTEAQVERITAHLRDRIMGEIERIIFDGDTMPAAARAALKAGRTA
jgi:hypothetical protein